MSRMFLPFSDRARKWEPLAQSLRQIARVSYGGLLDPWSLAPKVGLTVLSMADVIDLLPPEIATHLIGDGSPEWSGGVLPVPLPDGTKLCILNSQHSVHRRKVTLMEEIAHVHLGHQPTRLVVEDAGVRARNYEKRTEEEAYGVGAAALLPWGSFFDALNRGDSVEQLSATFEVSTQLVEYRIKVCGATSLYRARQRSSAGLKRSQRVG